MKRKSIRYHKPRKESKIRRIQSIINQLGRERGELAEKKVFQVLENWLVQKLILSYDQSSKWGYDDYIRHVDGYFLTLAGEMVSFQIKSSPKAAQKHREEYPDIPVIVVKSGISLNELDQQMRELFKDKLPDQKS